MSRTALTWAAVAAVLLGTAPQTAAQGPVPHHVRYTVTADQPTKADIYYRAVDPLTWADYSHNPYRFSPKAEVVLEPGRPWVFEATLVEPDRWAMVTATSGVGSDRPNFRCELAVDGVVVSTHSGPKGALCSLRSW
ncbi:hypothetical protein [Mycolicibacterium litorale]|uniref:Secreted protein n=1 Tax=Mycolicibacterium litorale TaxID=758802 RepID=A0AAD1IMR0_9MYCO|nr:hypothetical protein [Mycolicibacterium litorale]MCV7417078.1 hypothetical protein [Mycolicibacterium litorale]TDY04865.1 hypothetical protein BCL50_3645 [Mycolicibacterium litorale]BBY18294.1 hypothetical protein MLIT_38860 [Mycolicibacterium litorale]